MLAQLTHRPTPWAAGRTLLQSVALELQQMREHKHVYKRHKPTSTGVTLGQAKPAATSKAVMPSGAEGGSSAGGKKQPATSGGVKANKTMLSFGDDDEDQ